MAKKLISTKKLNHEQLTELVFSSPIPKSLGFVFYHPRVQGEQGLILISDNSSEKILVSLLQSPDSWMYKTKPSQVFINISNPKNITYRNQYIKGSLDRGYQLSEGRVVFAYGGNTSNPDKLSWHDSFAEMSSSAINLTIGESTPKETISELESWLKEFI